MKFPPTLAAAQARLAAVDPEAYARSRNHLAGAVTRLSPYITHGVLSLPAVLQAVRRRRPLPTAHKFVQELAWREYFHHVARYEGEAMLSSLHEGPLPDAAYTRELPDDIRHAATGVPVIDQAIRTLYADAWLHNHARMWLASYVVHLRKVHWRTGADWMIAHLLDGDLPSNHLSWQWVAGTGSHRPYLFNAENVARYAPAAWHSEGTPLDTTYEALDSLARQPRTVRVDGPDLAGGVDEPRLWHEPPPGLGIVRGMPPPGARTVHAWALRGEAADGLDGGIGVFSAAFHRRWPWRAARWRFVSARMHELGLQPMFVDGLPDLQPLDAPTLFDAPTSRCRSFSQFWSRVSRPN